MKNIRTTRFTLSMMAAATFATAACAGDPALERLADLEGNGRGIYVVSETEVWVIIDDSLVWIDTTSNKEHAVFVDGLPLSAPARLLSEFPGSLDRDGMYVSDWNTEETAGCCDGRIFQFDEPMLVPVYDGGHLAGVGDPFGLAHSPGGEWGDGEVYFSDFQGAGSGIPFIGTIGGSPSIFAQDAGVIDESSFINDIKFSGDPAYGDFLYVAESQDYNGIVRVDPKGDMTLFTEMDVTDIYAIEFGDGGCGGDTDMFVLTTQGAAGELRKVNTDGSSVSLRADLTADGASTIASDLAWLDDRRLLATFGSTLYAFRMCGADINLDCTVNTEDLLSVLAAWGSCEPCDEDFNADGSVDVSDLLFLLSSWGDC